MNFNIFVICLCLFELKADAVKNDCDGFFECLTDVFREFLGSEVNKTEILKNDSLVANLDNIVTTINVKATENNTSINAFDLSNLQKGLLEVITDVKSLIIDRSNSKLKVDYEKLEIVDNKTNIHTKIYGLKDDSEEANQSNDELAKLNAKVILSDDIKDSTEFYEKQEVEYINTQTTSTPILGLDVNNIDNNETINITGKIVPIITDNILNISHVNYETEINNPAINFENESEIYIEPLHIEIIPEFTIPFRGGFQDVVKDLTDQIIKNISDNNFAAFTDKRKETFKYILNHKNEDNSQNSYSSIDEQSNGNIDHNQFLQDLLKDFQPPAVHIANTTTVFYNYSFPVHNGDNEISSDKDNLFKENNIDNEIPIDLDFDYETNETEYENTTAYLTIDYVELFKDVTVEAVQYKPTEALQRDDLNLNNVNSENDLDNVIEHSESQEVLAHDVNNGSNTQSLAQEKEPFTWIATIFVKNGTTSQFEYYCDGALVSERVILTAARCVTRADTPVQPDDIIVITGRRNLQTFTDGEIVHRVKQIKVHEGFTSSSEGSNDLAVLEIEEPVTVSEGNLPGVICDGEGTDDMTTGWAFTGDLTSIPFEKTTDEDCDGKPDAEKIFCATYGLDVSTCPSYGGLYTVKSNDKWCLRGIRTGDPADRGLCFEKRVRYTDLSEHKEWIVQQVV